MSLCKLIVSKELFEDTKGVIRICKSKDWCPKVKVQKGQTTIYKTRKRNAHRLNQWKAKRNQAVVNIKVHRDEQTDNPIQTDDTTQTDQPSSHDLDHNTLPKVLQKRERSTQRRYHIKGRPLTPIKYRNEEESQKPWNKCTSVRSPCMPELLCLNTEFIDGTESYSEAFDPDDPNTLVTDHRLRYNNERFAIN